MPLSFQPLWSFKTVVFIILHSLFCCLPFSKMCGNFLSVPILLVLVMQDRANFRDLGAREGNKEASGTKWAEQNNLGSGCGASHRGLGPASAISCVISGKLLYLSVPLCHIFKGEVTVNLQGKWVNPGMSWSIPWHMQWMWTIIIFQWGAYWCFGKEQNSNAWDRMNRM